jgi:hypothetical protein
VEALGALLVVVPVGREVLLAAVRLAAAPQVAASRLVVASYNC